MSTGLSMTKLTVQEAQLKGVPTVSGHTRADSPQQLQQLWHCRPQPGSGWSRTGAVLTAQACAGVQVCQCHTRPCLLTCVPSVRHASTITACHDPDRCSSAQDTSLWNAAHTLTLCLRQLVAREGCSQAAQALPQHMLGDCLSACALKLS